MEEVTNEMATAETVGAADDESTEEALMEDAASDELPPQRLMITKMVSIFRHVKVRYLKSLTHCVVIALALSLGVGEFQELCRCQDHWSVPQVLQCRCWAQRVRKIERH